MLCYLVPLLTLGLSRRMDFSAFYTNGLLTFTAHQLFALVFNSMDLRTVYSWTEKESVGFADYSFVIHKSKILLPDDLIG